MRTVPSGPRSVRCDGSSLLRLAPRMSPGSRSTAKKSWSPEVERMPETSTAMSSPGSKPSATGFAVSMVSFGSTSPAEINGWARTQARGTGRGKTRSTPRRPRPGRADSPGPLPRRPGAGTRSLPPGSPTNRSTGLSCRHSSGPDLPGLRAGPAPGGGGTRFAGRHGDGEGGLEGGLRDSPDAKQFEGTTRLAWVTEPANPRHDSLAGDARRARVRARRRDPPVPGLRQADN